MRMISLLKRLRAPQRGFNLAGGDRFRFRLDDGSYSHLVYQATRLRVVQGHLIVDGEAVMSGAVVARVSRPVRTVAKLRGGTS